MKKALLISLFILSVVSGHAQGDTSLHSNYSFKGTSLEPHVGLGTSESVQGGTKNPGWKVGCNKVYMIKNHWGFSWGLQVQKYSTTFSSGRDSVYYYGFANSPQWTTSYVQLNYDFLYLELPLMIRYMSNNRNSFGILAEAGLVSGFLFYGKEKGLCYNINYDSGSSPIPAPFNQSGPHSNPIDQSPNAFFNFQAHGALGIVSPVSESCSFIVDASINEGLISAGNSSRDWINNYPPMYYYTKNNTFQRCGAYANNPVTPNISSYGRNFSMLVSIRFNFKFH
jgi:hypothetical protein